MTKIKVIIAILLLGFINPLSAQEKGVSELKSGYGVVTSTQTMYDIVEIFEMVFTLGGISYENEKSTGAIHFGYNYALSKKFTLGGFFTYEQINNNVKSNNSTIGSMNSKFYTVGIESCFHYLSKDNFSMYSGLGLAYSFGNMNFESTSPNETSDKTTANIPNFQIIGVGIRAGNTLAGFAELGFGYKGVISAGISVKL